MPRYRIELLLGSKDHPTIEKMKWVDAAADDEAKRLAREWASAYPAVFTQAAHVRVSTEDRVEVWLTSITSEF